MRGPWMKCLTLSVLLLCYGLTACDSSTTQTAPQESVAESTSSTETTPAVTATPTTATMPVGSVTPTVKPDHSQAAGEFVDWMVAGEFGKAVATFDTTMSKALPEAKLSETWASIIGQVGAFRSRGEAVVAKDGAFEIVNIPCTFEKGKLNARVVYNKAGRVTGLWFK